MMSFETQNRAGGRRAEKTRAISPSTTTRRPDSQTKRNTAGTLRSAENRSRQLPRNSGSPVITESPHQVAGRTPFRRSKRPDPGVSPTVGYSKSGRINFRQNKLADRSYQSRVG